MHSSTSSSRDAGRGGGPRLVLYVAIGALLFIAADRLFAAALWSQVLRSGFRYSVLYREPVNADIVVLGNSRGMSLVDWPYLERQTHLKTFNLSFNGLPPRLARTLFLDYLDRNRTPSVLLLEMTTVFGAEALTGEMKLYAQASPRLATLIAEEYPQLGWGMKLSKLYAFNGEMAMRSLYYRNRNDHDWLVDGRVSEELLRYTEQRPVPRWEAPDARNLDEVAEIIRVARERGIRVVPVIAPYLPAFVRKSPNFGEIVAGLDRRFGIPMLDYSLAISDTALFADRYHLNRAGSKAFTERLVADGVLVSNPPPK